MIMPTHILGAAAVLFATALPTGVHAQTQPEIARDLLLGSRRQRMEAAHHAMALKPELLSRELRRALIVALEREGELQAQHRRESVGHLEYPELIARFALVVARLGDPASIPGLTEALCCSPPAAEALASFGEPAIAPIVAIVTEPGAADHGMLGLDALRWIVESTPTASISSAAQQSLRYAAHARLAHPRTAAELNRAVDFALALGDVELRKKVEALAADAAAVTALGIDPRHVARVRAHAEARLAGVPPARTRKP